MEAVGAVGGNDRRYRCRPRPPLRLPCTPAGGAKFIALIAGIFLLYDPIKTLSRIHITMQRSISGDGRDFRYPRLRIYASTIAPDAMNSATFAGHARIRSRHVPLRRRRERTLKDFSLQDRTGKKLRFGRRERRGQEHDSFPHSASLRSDYRSASGLTATTCARSRKIASPTDRASSRRIHFSFTTQSSRTSSSAGSMRPQEEIYAAAQAAYAHDFIMRAAARATRRSSATKVASFLAAQQQRLAIARALCSRTLPSSCSTKRPPRSDSESEQQIQLALERLALGPHRDRDRAPALHHSFRRSDRRDGKRADQGDRHARASCSKTPATIAAFTICSSTAIPKSPARKSSCSPRRRPQKTTLGESPPRSCMTRVGSRIAQGN